MVRISLICIAIADATLAPSPRGRSQDSYLRLVREPRGRRCFHTLSFRLDETLCSCQGAGSSRALRAGCWSGRGRSGPFSQSQISTRSRYLPRKEVIQPHVPVRLPCYDFTPLTLHTFDASPQKGWAGGFGCRRLGWCDGRCVQGPGTHSPRRADPRLLATPASRRRVAACGPNWGRLCGIRSPSRGGSPLCRPL